MKKSIFLLVLIAAISTKGFSQLKRRSYPNSNYYVTAFSQFTSDNEIYVSKVSIEDLENLIPKVKTLLNDTDSGDRANTDLKARVTALEKENAMLLEKLNKLSRDVAALKSAKGTAQPQKAATGAKN